jgi:hypothetical protein
MPGITVRGQILRNQFPVAGVPVTLFSNIYGRSALAYSGGDGMYYFYNIPIGLYTVELWTFGQAQGVLNVQVNPPYTDIQRLYVP